jgi:hypothetical protein
MAGPRKPVVLLCPTSWKGREVLRPLFQKHGWEVTEVSNANHYILILWIVNSNGFQDTEILEGDCSGLNLVWCSAKDVPWTRVLTGSLRASSYYLKTALNRKAEMHRMLENYIRREGSTSVLARALPETHIIDLQELEVLFERSFIPEEHNLIRSRISR